MAIKMDGIPVKKKHHELMNKLNEYIRATFERIIIL